MKTVIAEIRQPNYTLGGGDGWTAERIPSRRPCLRYWTSPINWNDPNQIWRIRCHEHRPRWITFSAKELPCRHSGSEFHPDRHQCADGVAFGPRTRPVLVALGWGVAPAVTDTVACQHFHGWGCWGKTAHVQTIDEMAERPQPSRHHWMKDSHHSLLGGRQGCFKGWPIWPANHGQADPGWAARTDATLSSGPTGCAQDESGNPFQFQGAFPAVHLSN